MRRSGVMTVLATLGLSAAAATAVLSAAVPAQAQTPQNLLSRARAPAVTLSEAPAQREGAEVVGPRRALRWNDSGRWGLNFNLNEPVGREADWGDVEAGAYYRLSPSLRVGAAAGLAPPETDPARAAQTDRRAQPRVRLETIFKF